MNPKLAEFKNDHEKYRKWSIQEMKAYYKLHGHREHTATQKEIEKCPICNLKLKDNGNTGIRRVNAKKTNTKQKPVSNKKKIKKGTQRGLCI